MGHTMKNTFLRAVAAMSLAAAAMMAPTAAQAYTDSPTAVVTPSVVAPGGVATFSSATGTFADDEPIAISATGAGADGLTRASVATQTNTSLSTTATSAGALATKLKVPTNARGTYTFTFTGTRSGTVLRSTLTIAGTAGTSTPAKGGLAVTGFDADNTLGLWLAGAGLVVAGGAVGVGAALRRRRAADGARV